MTCHVFEDVVCSSRDLGLRSVEVLGGESTNTQIQNVYLSPGTSLSQLLLRARRMVRIRSNTSAQSREGLQRVAVYLKEGQKQDKVENSRDELNVYSVVPSTDMAEVHAHGCIFRHKLRS